MLKAKIFQNLARLTWLTLAFILQPLAFPLHAQPVQPYVTVTQYGARGDGTTDCTAAFNAALSSGAKNVWVPYGTNKYVLSGPIIMPSNTRLSAHPAATMWLTNGVNTNLLQNAGYRGGAGATNIWIEGGIWDGNRTGNPTTSTTNWYGETFHLWGVTNLTIRDISFKAALVASIFVNKWENFTCENVVYENGTGSGGGLELDGPGRWAVVRNHRGITTDDFIALNAGNWPVVNYSSGNITDVLIDGLSVLSCTAALRFLTGTNLDGSLITISNVVVQNVTGRATSYGIEADVNSYYGYTNRFEGITIQNFDMDAEEGAMRWGGRINDLKLLGISYRRDEASPKPGIKITTGSYVTGLTLDGFYFSNVQQTGNWIDNYADVRELTVANGYVKGGGDLFADQIYGTTARKIRVSNVHIDGSYGAFISKHPTEFQLQNLVLTNATIGFLLGGTNSQKFITSNVRVQGLTYPIYKDDEAATTLSVRSLDADWALTSSDSRETPTQAAGDFYYDTAEGFKLAGAAVVTGFKLSTGPGANYVLTSDASGNGTWQPGAGAVNTNNFIASNNGRGTNTAFQGFIGFGTTNAQADLHVWGDSSNRVVLLLQNAAEPAYSVHVIANKNATNAFELKSVDGAMLLRHASGVPEKLGILPDEIGMLGLGTANPQTDFHIAGNISNRVAILLQNAGNTNYYAVLAAAADATNALWLQSASGKVLFRHITGIPDELRFFPDSDGLIGVPVRFRASGSLFEVNATPLILSGTVSSPGDLRYIGGGGTSNKFLFNVPAGGEHYFAVGQDIKMTIGPDGNVGIGESTPSQLFTVGAAENFQINTNGAVLAGIWNATTIAATNGGTGANSYTAGDLLYASSASALAKLGVAVSNKVLVVSSAGVPAWQSTLTNVGVNGVFDVKDGAITLSGTVSSPGDLRYIGGGGTANKFVFNVPSGGEQFFAVGEDIKMTIRPDGKVGIGETTPDALFTVGNGDKFQVNADGSVLISGAQTNSLLTPNRALISDSASRTTNSAVTSTELGHLAGATGNIQTNLDAKLSAPVNLSTQVTGTLPSTNGGTGQASWTTGDLLYSSSGNTLAKRGIGSTGHQLTVTNGLPTWMNDPVSLPQPGLTWTLWLGKTNAWHSVTYGNALFVAVGYSGTTDRVMTSPDAIRWTSRTSASTNGWYSVTYGNGLFVAVSYTGTGNRVMSSPDGITWTSRTSAADLAWNSVCYGNGLFVAVASTGTGNRVMSSPDGITWTSRTSAADNDWSSVTYANGLFVAVASTGTGNGVMSSPDGITWTSRTPAADRAWRAVTYGKGLFVAVASSGSGDRVMTSADAITWSLGSSAADDNWVGLTHGNGVFVAVAENGTSYVMTSGTADIIPFSSNNTLQGGLMVYGGITFGATAEMFSDATNLVLDFGRGEMASFTLSANVNFQQSTNRPSTGSKSVVRKFFAGGSNRTLTWPMAGGASGWWTNDSPALYTTLTNGTCGVLSLSCDGSSETNVIAIWKVFFR